ncbi:synaptogyrin-2a [Astyanax mexicanus]|uniref:Synaptogyrin n=2 Tax=Astyanax mexicanus TaxID=7994 RepID=A0A8B9H696_ASTMX|nr:synaptogyrin-2a [Astyanax mexicanus]KAG9263967.1 synaptogyrin-2-like [Astyanax mexicanus]
MESVYGAALSGGSFDFQSFIKKPQTIVRLLSWLFSIVVFATITAEGFVNQHQKEDTKCIFNQNDSACSYGNAVGILAFLACVAFIILDAYFPQISNANQRKHIVISDLVFSGAWTFLWFVCFCFLANQWSHTVEIEGIPQDAARAVIAFSFFSVISWALLTLFAFRRYHQGMDEVGYTDPSHDQTTPYPNYPSAPDNYQQAPFTHSSTGEGSYQPPAY